MKRSRTNARVRRDTVRQVLAVALLLGMVGFAVAGPSGIVAWSDSQKQLDQRQVEIARLTGERDQLRNKVDLLDPRHTDTDFAGELVRNRLNVVHKDDRVMLLH
jgi:cell division protein FtsB